MAPQGTAVVEWLWKPAVRVDRMDTMRQVLIYPDVEDGGWVCEVPSLPGCVSDGATKEEAIDNVRDAIEAWIDGARHLGRDIPEDALNAEICVI